MSDDPISGDNLSRQEPGFQLSARDRWLRAYLLFIGYFTLLAFVAALMPESWMIAIAKSLTIDPFPSDPLTFYLARNLSLLYGFVGIAVAYLGHNLETHRSEVPLLAMGTMLFGVLQLICDFMTGIPAWWTLGEGLSTVFGGAVMFWLARRE